MEWAKVSYGKIFSKHDFRIRLDIIKGGVL